VGFPDQTNSIATARLAPDAWLFAYNHSHSENADHNQYWYSQKTIEALVQVKVDKGTAFLPG
jgi:hypothetical protein